MTPQSSETVLAIWQTSELKQLENMIARTASNSEAERASKNARLMKQQEEGKSGSSETPKV